MFHRQIIDMDLYFFYHIDVAILVVGIYADDVSLSQAQKSLFRFGRCYPTYWEPDGHGSYCPKHVEWLSAKNKVLARMSPRNYLVSSSSA